MTRALVTGASAGIGREFARQLAARGDDLVVVARDRTRLELLAGELHAAHGVDVEVLPADLLTPGGLDAVAGRLAGPTGSDAPVDLLVNNAGFGTFGQFAELDVEHELDEVRLNVVALVRLTHAALGPMRARRDGAIVNISSIAGYQPAPHGATYGATKAFVSSFTHAVHEEERTSGVRILLVCPGYTHSEFHERAGLGPSHLPDLVWQDAADVVRTALADLGRGRSVSIPGAINRVVASVSSVTPPGISRRVARIVVRRT